MEEAGDLHDWEILPNPNVNPVPVPTSSQMRRQIDAIGSDSSGVYKSDYFAIQHGKKSSELDAVYGLVESSNSRYVDVVDEKKVVGDKGTDISHGELRASELDSVDWGLGRDAKREVRFGGIEASSGAMGDFLSGSCAADGVSWKVGGFDEWGFGEDAKREVGLEAISDIEGAGSKRKNPEEFWSDMSSDDGMVFEKDSKGELGREEGESFEGIAIEQSQKDELLLDAGGDVAEGEAADFSKSDVGESLAVLNVAADEVKAREGEKKAVMWWKVPLELLKLWVFRVSPVWSISIAAAVLGIVILRRRLYRMKRKNRSIPLNVSVDQKVMVRVARLNEAFSVARRIPILQAPVPAAGGVTTMPLVSLR